MEQLAKKEMTNVQKIAYVIDELSKGITRDTLATELGYSNYKCIDIFLGKSTNTFTLTVGAEEAAGTTMKDYVSVDLEGADGKTYTVKLNAVDETTGSNSATTFKVASGNNELTYSIDGEETTITMDNQTYDGTTTVFASNSARIDGNAGVADTFAVSLTGATFSITTTADASLQDATHFKVGADVTETTANIAESLQKAIDADDRTKGLFTVSVNKRNEITVTATKATSDLAVGAFTATDNGTANGFARTAGTILAGAAGKSTDTLVNYLQAKMDAQVYSTTTVASTTEGVAGKVEFTSNSEADAAGILKLNDSVAEAGKDQQAKELTFQIGANNGQSMGVTITDMRANALGVSGQLMQHILKYVHMTDLIDPMVKDYSIENNVSQKVIFTVALVGFFRKHGFAREINTLLGM